MLVKVGTYTGNGGSQSINVGFRPAIVFIGRGGNSTEYKVFKTDSMSGNVTAYFANGAVNFAGITITDTGFDVNSANPINASGAPNTYYWAAFAPDGVNADIAHGYYTVGSTPAVRSITGLGFQPDIVGIKGDIANAGCWRQDTFGAATDDRSALWGPVALFSTSLIQKLLADGFEVGTGVKAQTANSTHYWFAFKKLANVLTTASYVGNGSDNRDISVGFQPAFVWVKGPNATSAVLRFKDEAAPPSEECLQFFNSAALDDAIQNFEPTNFEVGTRGVVNTSGATSYHWAAFAENAATPATVEVGADTASAESPAATPSGEAAVDASGDTAPAESPAATGGVPGDAAAGADTAAAESPTAMAGGDATVTAGGDTASAASPQATADGGAGEAIAQAPADTAAAESPTATASGEAAVSPGSGTGPAGSPQATATGQAQATAGADTAAAESPTALGVVAARATFGVYLRSYDPYAYGGVGTLTVYLASGARAQADTGAAASPAATATAQQAATVQVGADTAAAVSPIATPAAQGKVTASGDTGQAASGEAAATGAAQAQAGADTAQAASPGVSVQAGGEAIASAPPDTAVAGSPAATATGAAQVSPGATSASAESPAAAAQTGAGATAQAPPDTAAAASPAATATVQIGAPAGADTVSAESPEVEVMAEAVADAPGTAAQAESPAIQGRAPVAGVAFTLRKPRTAFTLH